MQKVIEIVFLSVIYLTALTAYVWLISTVIPKCLLRIKYDVSHGLGRGLKKFTYPEGRAVVYEPHPSVRKYVNKHLLFTLDGYKYIQFLLDAGVKSYTANVVCFDNRNKVIDVLELSESMVASSVSCPLRLHHKTSYVATVLRSVNKTEIPGAPYMKIRLSRSYGYLLAVSALTFLEFVHIMITVNRICDLIDRVAFNVSYAFFILPALAVGVACLGVTLIGRIKKGVKVIWK